MLWKAWACNLTMNCKSQFECFGISADDPQFMSHLFQLFQMFASCCNSSGVPWCAIIKHCQIVCGKSHKNGKNNQIKCSKRSQLVQLLCLFPICFQSLLFYYIQNCISLSGYFSRKDATFIWFFFFFFTVNLIDLNYAEAEENTDFIFKVTYAQIMLMYLPCTGETEA